MKTLIKGDYYAVNWHNEVVIYKKPIPIKQDVYGNFWIINNGELIQLRTFEHEGIVFNMDKAIPEFMTRAPVSKLREEAGVELSDIDQAWSLDRSEFYMILTYRVKDI